MWCRASWAEAKEASNFQLGGVARLIKAAARKCSYISIAEATKGIKQGHYRKELFVTLDVSSIVCSEVEVVEVGC